MVKDIEMAKRVGEISDKEKYRDYLGTIMMSGIRTDESEDMFLLYSDDLGSLKSVSEKFEPGSNYLRQCNLEDLFLRMTGRDLGAAQ